MIFDIGMGEMMVIFLIVLMLFGADRIPQLAKGLGKGIRDFKRVVNGYQNEIQRIVEQEEIKPPPRKMPPPKIDSPASDSKKSDATEA
ncbi:MAG: twin-arginine translocase TatA/TatE family subunit [Candidatus Latescibacteria bacterium]|jgi:sec-independent protein translocase protein TatA|nr:twin-arginine translocase TatA/TatE family subunit [Candidatus Latescibacterota bacterium]